MSIGPHITQRLAAHVTAAQSRALSAEARDGAQRCLLDLLAATAAGLSVTAVVAARRAAPLLFRDGSASVWFTGERLSASGAAFCNAAAASALDLDDGNRAARGHPGASVIPAALAVVEETNADADALLAAIATGYDVAVAVGAERGFYARSGMWCGFGAIAAAAFLRRTPEDQVAQAMAIYGMTAPNLQGVADGTPYPPSLGNDVKEGIPWATATALAALPLAEAGMTGPLDMLDHAPHHRAESIAARLAGPPAINQTYFKFYCCCRHLHAPIDALLAVMAEYALAPDAIDAVEVHIYRGAFNLSNRVNPANLVDLQYSIPYCLGLVALHGPDTLLPLEESALDRADAIAFAGKVSLHLDPEIDRRFPAESLARVVVVAGERRYESRLTHPHGEAFDPPTRQALEQKFSRASGRSLDRATQQRVIEALARLKIGQVAPLYSVLARAAFPTDNRDRTGSAPRRSGDGNAQART
ncbi:MmgE/PrpD family protein [Pelagibius sp. 7325]|uniref:MmgE/PrpD family protein n=1 Tax=Pelagibius sp. 7325 TaxID=3131994 RepID=UPI0030ECAFA2